MIEIKMDNNIILDENEKINIFKMLNEEINIFNKNEDEKNNNKIINYKNDEIKYKILLLEEVYITIVPFIEVIISKTNINRELKKISIINKFKSDNLIYINKKGIKEYLEIKLSKNSLSTMRGRLNNHNFNKYYNYLKFIKMNINYIFC